MTCFAGSGAVVSKTIAVWMLPLLILAGCSAMSSPSASPAFTPEGRCLRDGAYWHASMNYCEYQFGR